MINLFALFGWFCGVLQIKHFLCDYQFQTAYMVVGKSSDKYVKPLLLHSGVHMAGMLTCLTAFYAVMVDYNTTLIMDNMIYIFLLSGIDGVSHFVIDYFTAQHGEKDIKKTMFWNELGLDQMCHHVIGIFLLFCILTG